jgi:hypothetical protein
MPHSPPVSGVILRERGQTQFSLGVVNEESAFRLSAPLPRISAGNQHTFDSVLLALQPAPTFP